MAKLAKYSDILADILERKHSRCTCPTEYFNSGLKPKIPDTNKGGCQFGPDCQFLSCENSPPVVCEFNLDKCTCFAKCICGPQVQSPVQLIPDKELDKVINEQSCICAGNCLCESEDSLEIRNIYRSPPNCNKAKCICNVCLCRPDGSEYRLLPTDFRNAVKKEALTCDERIKKECEEIKQLLNEHEENRRRELEEPSTQINSDKNCDKGNKKGPSHKVSIVEESSTCPQQPETNKEDAKSCIIPQDESHPKPEPKEPPDSPEANPKETKPKRKKGSRKEKKPKWKQPKISPSKSTTPSQYTQYSCGCRIPKKKPLRMRYYFAGGTENYGVKVGHKDCLPKCALVPKNMGWLWSLEDPSKGIRERKGWPPGFIGKNIKNMIKVLKQFEETGEAVTRPTPGGGVVGGRRWRAATKWEVEEAEPQEEPPLLHIHKKGRTYNITFCPKSSDQDIGPIPIPFSITEKKRDSDSDSSDSTLEFEFHSPKPRLKTKALQQQPLPENLTEEDAIPLEPSQTTLPPSTTTNKPTKKKINKKRSKSSEENKNLWEEQQTQIQNIT